MFADPDALAALRARLGNQQPQSISQQETIDAGPLPPGVPPPVGIYGPTSQMAKDLGTGPGPGGGMSPQMPPTGMVPPTSPLGQLGAQSSQNAQLPQIFDDDWNFNPSNSITPQAKQAAIKQLIASLAGYQ